MNDKDEQSENEIERFNNTLKSMLFLNTLNRIQNKYIKKERFNEWKNIQEHMKNETRTPKTRSLDNSDSNSVNRYRKQSHSKKSSLTDEEFNERVYIKLVDRLEHPHKEPETALHNSPEIIKRVLHNISQQKKNEKYIPKEDRSIKRAEKLKTLQSQHDKKTDVKAIVFKKDNVTKRSVNPNPKEQHLNVIMKTYTANTTKPKNKTEENDQTDRIILVKRLFEIHNAINQKRDDAKHFTRGLIDFSTDELKHLKKMYEREHDHIHFLHRIFRHLKSPVQQVINETISKQNVHMTTDDIFDFMLHEDIKKYIPESDRILLEQKYMERQNEKSSIQSNKKIEEDMQRLISDIKERPSPPLEEETNQETYNKQIVSLTKQIKKLKTDRSKILSQLQRLTKSKQTSRQKKITSEKNEKLQMELETVESEIQKIKNDMYSLHVSIQEELQTLTPDNQYISEQFLSQLDEMMKTIDDEKSTHFSR